MKCKNCNSEVKKNSKFCDKCGKPIDWEKLKIEPAIHIEKIKKNLKNTGNTVYGLGWLTIIGNVGIYIWSVLDRNFSETGLPESDLSGIFIMVVAASIFIILGKRIREAVDKNTKIYLEVLIGLSLVILIWSIASGGRVGILFFIVIAYLISSFRSVKKAMKTNDFNKTLTEPKYKLDKKGWIIFGIVALILFFRRVSPRV